ncbi:hypothetical protein JOD63_003230 [Microbacterium terrae]|uniref:DUF4407 domain-containing protein n=1 Tax=Microbacterium terrae TaxID=69369 RepID=A0A0M2H127_9MICO|nr:DUF4407 domain-containing protein [Microbacterium terrae]KJL40118.1 hypothetical protein RS81_01708 [Microbacterium terrae]MBP1079262.1 hypothetical protein [Microbacterium terrae]GLJ98661.1 hypothetical protein GCM10017594_18580 [Microbacterium terrae]
MSFSAHRPGRFGSDGRIEFEGPDDETEELYLDDVRAAQTADGPEDPYPQTRDLLDDAIAMNPTQPTAVITEQVGEWGSVAEPAAVAEPVEAPAPVAEPDPVAEPVEAPAAAAAAEKPARRRRPPRERGSASRRLAILGGADGSVLDEVPTETPRFVQMFFVLAGTALVSAISMMFALTTGVRVALALAIPLAIVWALIIFNLDRFLTSTMRSTRNVWKLIALAIPRVIMAAIIGIVVAEPLVLQVFHNDIAREVTTTNLTQAQADQDAVTSGPEKLALDAASERVAALENQAASGVVAGADTTSATTAAAQATVDDLTTKLADQQAVIDQARAIYQCELTGEGADAVDGCSGVAGEGASSTAAEDQLAAAQTAYDALAAKLTTAQAELAAAQSAGTAATSASESLNKQQAADELPAAREQYEAALAAYNARASDVAGGNAEAVGLLSQITALESLSQREPVLGWAHGLIAALFFMIELLPVLVKVLTSYGDPTLYEKADALRRQVALDKVTARSWRERAAIAQGGEA